MFEAMNTPSYAILFLVAALFSLGRRLARKTATGASLPLPPGPPTFPIVGNALQLDSVAPWETYMKWSKTYGDLIYSRLLNQDVIIINSERIARDLLDRRSYNYSDRPMLVTTELFGWTFNVGFFCYGDKWRKHRRMMDDKLRSTAALAYRPLQMRKAHQLLIDILEAPNEFVHHLQMMTASTMMLITYGYEAEHRDDPLVDLVENAVMQGLKVMTPEAAAILGAWPFLLYLPSWFPGAGFKKKAQESRNMLNEMVEKPFEYTTSHMDSNEATACMVSDVLGQIKDEGNYVDLDVVKNVASTLFAGASETTTATLVSFILAMVLYPNVQEQARAEIESVVGRDRLPNFDDRDSLPYVEAVVRETQRWHPIAPLGVAHAAVNDDIYEGYYIPKGQLLLFPVADKLLTWDSFSGATVIANAWAISQNEANYHNPSDFNPQRFFTVDGKLNDDKVLYAFGFGRRICVGRHLADASLWAAIASLLAVFKFSKALDEQGKEINIEPQWTAGLTARPFPFACNIQPTITMEKLHQMIDQFA
ncbi:hypothetical protein SERLA73DRAFT_75263 [Serpula lacrymans var. lacrymans S7.3]|uniref:Cytochrome P450 n=2 Tax=Serpula lacrymans var. lacrymans TaxID=341189 RepID=F8Q337_SERL3|nr:uncharacterized protein SERLADRAFT_439936 [Serpula lacrymans var. lacrymans S7.9]EGN97598.1 hypothetical protein SERLA73DRAFT_75263 [Serpula lacrymans var. lacrymans S7.3]EGO23190.1 hypothetical protein SERLADRAFT_439936 [Serpula lacrymans var. lacrymans S7.9]